MSNRSKTGDVAQAKRARASRKGRPRGLKWGIDPEEASDNFSSRRLRTARKSGTKSRARRGK